MAILSLQKANFWKRLSAWLLDAILVVMLTTGLAAFFSLTFGYDTAQTQLETYYTKYAEDYGIDLSISEEDYNKLSAEEKENFQAASDAFGKDPEVLAVYGKIFNLTLSILSISILFSTLSIYFVVPLFFKNGQTLGKKIFGLAVIRTNLVKATTPVLFIRALFGVCVIEHMFPVFLIVMVYFGTLGAIGPITLVLFCLLQIIVLCSTKTHSAIHDLLSDTVVVDYASQRVFETQEEMLEYVKEQQAIEAQNAPY